MHMIDRANLIILTNNEDPLCKIKTRTINFNISVIEKNTPDNELTILFVPPANK